MSDAMFLTRSQGNLYIKNKYGIGGKHTLAKAARTGSGPDYRILGKSALYNPRDLDEWMLARMQDPAAFKRGRPRNLPTQKRAVGGGVAERQQPIAAPALEQNHTETLAKAFDVLRQLGIQN
jgi:hypothetical protein